MGNVVLIQISSSPEVGEGRPVIVLGLSRRMSLITLRACA